MDNKPRYLPETLLTIKGESAVISAVAYPPHKHPADSPIIPSMTAVKATLGNGRSRWYGCERAYINSHLRMVLVGFDERDEVRAKWEVAKD